MDLTSLAELHSPSGSLISLYLDRPTGSASAAITDLLKPIRAAADTMERSIAKAVLRDCEHIQGLVPKIDAQTATGVAMFMSSTDDVHEVSFVDHGVWDHASIGPRAYLRPLRSRPRPLRTGIVVADRRRCRIYLGDDGTVDPLGEALEADIGKSNFGGFAGYEEHGVRRRAEHETARMLKEAASRLLVAHQEQPLDALLLGGHQETLDELVPHLHAYLRALPVGRAVVDPHTLTLPELRRRVADHAVTLRATWQEEHARAAVEGVETGSGAAGTAALLEAANARAIDRLLVAGLFEKPGVVCGACGWLARAGRTCAMCGSAAFEVEDVIGYLMEAVAAAGGAVDQLEIATPVDPHGVVGTLRFPM
jgi:peptide subunit release factor 1 (eRF1)